MDIEPDTSMSHLVRLPTGCLITEIYRGGKVRGQKGSEVIPLTGCYFPMSISQLRNPDELPTEILNSGEWPQTSMDNRVKETRTRSVYIM